MIRSLVLLAAAVVLAAPGARAQLDLPVKPVPPAKASKASDPELPPVPRGDLAQRVTGTGKKSSGGDLVLPDVRANAPVPAASVAAQPAPDLAAAAQPPIATPAGSSAAEFVMIELAKVDDLDHRIVRHAERSLLALGDSGRAAARVALFDEHPPTLLVGARTLLSTGDPTDADLVLRRIEERMPRSVCAPMVAALIELDPVRASPDQLALLLCHQQSAVRAAAHRELERQASPAMLSALLVPLDGRLTDSRLRATQLAASVRDPAVMGLLLQRLGDRSSTVAVRAMTSLAAMDDERVESELLRRAFGMRWILRDGSYALLAIAEREDRTVTAILGAEHIEPLLEGLDANDPFVAGACATSLAGVGFRSESPDTEWLDRDVPHRLVRTVGGEDFHNDYSALQPAALRRLSLISGEHFGSDGPRWVAWWTDAAPFFSARRAVISAGLEQAPDLRLSVRSSLGAPDAYRLLGPAAAVEPRPDETLEVEELYLTETQARELFEVLEAEGVFGSGRLPGTRGDVAEGARVLDIAVSGRGKQFRFGGERTEPWFDRTLATAGALREQNRWQLFLGGEDLRGRVESWQREAGWWDVETDVLARQRRLKEMAFAHLAARKPSERDMGTAELAVLATEPGVVDAVDFPAVLELLEEEWFVGPRVRALIQVGLACARDASGSELPEPDLARDLVDAVIVHHGANAAPELSALLAQCGPELTREAAADERPFLRAVAAATLAQDPSEEDLEVLLGLLEDADQDVEIAAVLALGENRVEEARTELLVRARVGAVPVRVAALQAVGRLGGDGAFDALLVGLAQRDHPEVVNASASGLADLGDPQAAPLLISLLAKGRESDAYGPARDGLLRLGEAAWPDLLRVVHSPAHRGRRDAAILLSQQGVPQAASAMMSILTDTPDDARVAAELAILTCVDYRADPDAVVAWWGWWDLVVHDDALAWFRGELERMQVETPGPEQLVAPGTREGALFLLEVMHRDEEHLVERARRELERMTATSLEPLPPRGAERNLQLAELRREVDDRYK